MAKSVAQRKDDLAAAKDKFRRRPKAKLSLEELASVYGLVKSAFVNMRNGIEGFPEPNGKEGNAIYYPAYKAVSALYDYVVRREQQALKRGRRFNALVQVPAGDDAQHPGLTMSAQEQLRAFELRDKLRKEAIEQGELHRSADCARVTERVFSLISQKFGLPTASMDPTGKWPADIRKSVDEAGQALVLQVYADLEHMLGGHADHSNGRSSPPGTGRSGAKREGKARPS